MTDNYDLLFELGTEELPQGSLKTLSDTLTKEFLNSLSVQNLKYDEVVTFAAPRRLGLFIKQLQSTQPDRKVTKKGPYLNAAFDKNGSPTKAALGFAQSCGASIEQLKRTSNEKGELLVYESSSKGKSTSELLPEIAQSAVSNMHLPKKMRWGNSDAQFIRPAKWILFLYGNKVINCEILGIKSAQFTYGHRFHHPDQIKIKKPSEYASSLEKSGKVIALFSERKKKIKTYLNEAAKKIGGDIILDESLLNEVTSLCDWPIPIVGSFEKKFLEIPNEILIQTMKTNQKYFPVFDKNKRLTNKFIAIANIESKDPSIIQKGNERVIRPRFSDAMFFWQKDKSKTLQEHGHNLNSLIFQKELGSMLEKSNRVSALAVEISKAIGGDVHLTARAGKLSRCDLLTETVNEFPSIQGTLGRHKATLDGEEDEVCKALEEFYLPRFSGDVLPKTKVGIAISLADKIDSLIGIFGIKQKPTGDKDPYGLRRAALGVIRIIRENNLELDLPMLLALSAKNFNIKKFELDVCDTVNSFFLDRLKGVYTEEGIKSDIFDSVAAKKLASLTDFDLRVKAIINFISSKDALELCSTNKRIKNILKKASGSIPTKIDENIFESKTEGELYKKIIDVELSTKPMKDRRDYSGILIKLLDLKLVLDNFFNEVMVMDENKNLRNNRLALLNKLHNLFLDVADISLLQIKDV